MNVGLPVARPADVLGQAERRARDDRACARRRSAGRARRDVRAEMVECEVPVRVWPANTAFKATEVVFDV